MAGENGNGKPTCRGTTKAGKPCGSTIVNDDGYCYVHGTPPEVLAEKRAAGGRAWGAKRRELAKTGREVLREWVQEHTDEIVQAYEEGLAATDSDGNPDYRARVQAATALLAEAYGKPVQPVEDQTDRVTLVLAPIRDPDYRPPPPPESLAQLPKPPPALPGSNGA